MAVALGAAGWDVIVHYNRSAEAAGKTAELIRQAGGQAVCVQTDLADETETARLLARARDAIGQPISLLVNNASTYDDDDALSHTRADWDHHMEINLRAPVHLAQCFANNLPSNKKGHIVNLIDQRVWRLEPSHFTYMISKSALWTATRTLAQALAPNIRVNAIGPGPTLQAADQSAEDFDTERAHTLTGEGASPGEIVKALFYLIDASAVTGQMIAVDGGQHLMWKD